MDIVALALARKYAKGMTDDLRADTAADIQEVEGDIADTNTRIDQLPYGLDFKGAVDYYGDLPASGNTSGDTYVVKYTGSSGTTPDGTMYAWGDDDGTDSWIEIFGNGIPDTDIRTIWEDN